MFVQDKKNRKRIQVLVNLTARNDITIKDNKPIPKESIILNTLAQAHYRSKIHLSDACFQTKIESDDYLTAL